MTWSYIANLKLVACYDTLLVYTQPFILCSQGCIQRTMYVVEQCVQNMHQHRLYKHKYAESMQKVCRKMQNICKIYAQNVKKKMRQHNYRL